MQTESFVSDVVGRYEPKVVNQEGSGHDNKSERYNEKSSRIIPKAKVKDVSELEVIPVVKEAVSETPEEKKELFPQIPEKEPAESSIDSAVTQLNAQLKRIHCDYSYDEETKRIKFKVYDDETEELIREVPSEKSLDALKKLWEIAGIIIDEKR